MSAIWKRSQDTSSSHYKHSTDHDSDLSLVAHPNRKEIRYETRAEAGSVQGQPKLTQHILVHTNLSQREEMVQPTTW